MYKGDDEDPFTTVPYWTGMYPASMGASWSKLALFHVANLDLRVGKQFKRLVVVAVRKALMMMKDYDFVLCRILMLQDIERVTSNAKRPYAKSDGKSFVIFHVQRNAVGKGDHKDVAFEGSTSDILALISVVQTLREHLNPPEPRPLDVNLSCEDPNLASCSVPFQAPDSARCGTYPAPGGSMEVIRLEKIVPPRREMIKRHRSMTRAGSMSPKRPSSDQSLIANRQGGGGGGDDDPRTSTASRIEAVERMISEKRHRTEGESSSRLFAPVDPALAAHYAPLPAVAAYWAGCAAVWNPAATQKKPAVVRVVFLTKTHLFVSSAATPSPEDPTAVLPAFTTDAALPLASIHQIAIKDRRSTSAVVSSSAAHAVRVQVAFLPRIETTSLLALEFPHEDSAMAFLQRLVALPAAEDLTACSWPEELESPQDQSPRATSPLGRTFESGSFSPSATMTASPSNVEFVTISPVPMWRSDLSFALLAFRVRLFQFYEHYQPKNVRLVDKLVLTKVPEHLLNLHDPDWASRLSTHSSSPETEAAIDEASDHTLRILCGKYGPEPIPNVSHYLELLVDLPSLTSSDAVQQQQRSPPPSQHQQQQRVGALSSPNSRGLALPRETSPVTRSSPRELTVSPHRSPRATSNNNNDDPSVSLAAVSPVHAADLAATQPSHASNIASPRAAAPPPPSNSTPSMKERATAANPAVGTTIGDLLSHYGFSTSYFNRFAAAYFPSYIHTDCTDPRVVSLFYKLIVSFAPDEDGFYGAVLRRLGGGGTSPSGPPRLDHNSVNGAAVWGSPPRHAVGGGYSSPPRYPVNRGSRPADVMRRPNGQIAEGASIAEIESLKQLVVEPLSTSDRAEMSENWRQREVDPPPPIFSGRSHIGRKTI